MGVGSGQFLADGVIFGVNTGMVNRAGCASAFK